MSKVGHYFVSKWPWLTPVPSLRRSEITLREQLNEVRSAARQRELELLADIASLKATLEQRARVFSRTTNLLSDLVTQEQDLATEQVQGAVRHELNLLDPDGGEISMELATPLMPTSALCAYPPLSPHLQNSRPSSQLSISQSNHPRFHDRFYHEEPQATIPHEYDTTPQHHSFYVDPPSIPLPPSPDGLSEWEDNSHSPTLSQVMIVAAAFPLPPMTVPASTSVSPLLAASPAPDSGVDSELERPESTSLNNKLF